MTIRTQPAPVRSPETFPSRATPRPLDPLKPGPRSRAYRAAQLPFLDPGFQVALSYAAVLGLLPSPAGFVIWVTGSLDGSPVELRYTKAAGDVRGDGTLGGNTVSERLYPLEDRAGLRFEGRVGDVVEDLTLVPDRETLKVAGTLGGADTDLRLRFQNEGEELVLTFDGQIAGEHYHTVSRMTMDPETYQGRMQTAGTVADELISKEFTIAPTPDGAVKVRGEGRVAGVLQQLTYRIEPR